MRFLTTVLLMLLSCLLCAGCARPIILASEAAAQLAPQTPPPPEIGYILTVSAPPVQISGGNLHWHKSLPSDSFTLEDMAFEVTSNADSDIMLGGLQVTVDDDTMLLPLNRWLRQGETATVVFQPMMAGYDGGVHCITLELRDDAGGILYLSSVNRVGPLEPEAATGEWSVLAN